MRAFSKIEALLVLTFNNFFHEGSGSCPTAYVHFSAHNLTESDLHVAGDITQVHRTCTLENLHTMAIYIQEANLKFEEGRCLLDLEVNKSLSKGRLNTRLH